MGTNCFTDQITGIIFCTIIGDIFDSEDNKSNIVANVQCESDPSNPGDIAASSDCSCGVTSATEPSGVQLSGCTCEVCPDGVGEAPITVSCPVPILGSCSTLDCDNACNGNCLPDIPDGTCVGPPLSPGPTPSPTLLPTLAVATTPFPTREEATQFPSGFATDDYYYYDEACWCWHDEGNAVTY